jgi:hypothetical protein
LGILFAPEKGKRKKKIKNKPWIMLMSWSISKTKRQIIFLKNMILLNEGKSLKEGKSKLESSKEEFSFRSKIKIWENKEWKFRSLR